jgi:phosphomannomutase
MTKIKFGTDGWRAIIAEDYTTANVRRVTFATAQWLKKQNDNPTIVIGNDCRFGGELFVNVATEVFINEGVNVIKASTSFVSTPMISLATIEYGADAGIVITASHNPPSYNGFKIKANFGGPATPDQIAEVESLIPDNYTPTAGLTKGNVSSKDFEALYIQKVNECFDLDAIKNSGFTLAYDAMFGAGQSVAQKILPNLKLLNCEFNPSFNGQAPEPIHKNLLELSEIIKTQGEIDAAFATDGDADRIGMYDEDGHFVDSHHIILLLIYYLSKHKGLNGTVISTFSCSQKIDDLCKKYEIDNIVTKIGFKYICDLMVNDGVSILVGGEESGGIAISGHVPERDGIWIALTIFEFMAKTGKSLKTLIQEIYDEVGAFSVERNDMHLSEELKLQIIQNCKDGVYNKFGTYSVQKVEDLDGYKFHLGNGEWIMIRPSGTEPVLRTYAEAETKEKADAILSAVEKTLLNL